MSKFTGFIYFSPVASPKENLSEKVHVRSSSSRERTVYLRLPAAVAAGVYLSIREANILKLHLENAIEDAQHPLPSQDLEVTLVDGTVVRVPVPKGTRARSVRLA